MKEIYPVTIIKSRYSGAYEGGKWVAFNEDAYSDLMHEALGDDMACADFFRDIDNPKVDMKNVYDQKIYCGRGNTPQEAYDDLVSKIKK